MADELPNDPRVLAGLYVEEMRQETHVALREVGSIARPRSVFWTLTLVTLLILAGGGLAVLRLSATKAPVSVGPLTLNADDPCTQRQQAIMRAIAEYVSDHDEVPKDLSLLTPTYLAEPPVDPLSGRPYAYRHNGNAVFLACPNPELHRH